MNIMRKHFLKQITAGILACSSFFPVFAAATQLNASSGGTVIMNLDRNAYATAAGGNPSAPGYYLTRFFDSAYIADNFPNIEWFPADPLVRLPEATSTNLVHTITDVSSLSQEGFGVPSSADFSINTDSLTGTGFIGMVGVHQFQGLFRGSLMNGDFTLEYNQASRQQAWTNRNVSGTPSGWFLKNNFSFGAAAYDLGSLSLLISDTDNWQLSGDLLISPENAAFIGGGTLKGATDVGNFCVGLGSHAGCGAVPVPASIWFFGSALMVFLRLNRHKI